LSGDTAKTSNHDLIPFKSAAYGRATLKGNADTGRILVKSSIPFRVSRFPLKTNMGNGKRETENEKVTNTIYAPFYEAEQNHVF
jgi:hypothetical protein